MTASNTSSTSITSGDAGRLPGSLIQTDQFLDRHGSVEGYSRIMLEYTQRRMAESAGPDMGGYATSRSSRSSNASSVLTSQTSSNSASNLRRGNPDEAGPRSPV